MKKIVTYLDLEVWKASRELVSSIYALTIRFPREETYGLISQIRRCAVSVPSNIAEGCGRQHTKDSIQFFYIARSSLYELETQLYLSSDQKFITAEELSSGLKQVTKCKKLLNGFIKYYESLISPKTPSNN